MEWKDIGKAVGKVAPMLGTLLGGPLTGTAVSIITDTLGLTDGAKPEDVELALSNNPDALVKLKTAEMEHKVELQRLVLKQEERRLDDVQDARRRQIASETAIGKRDTNLYVLAWLMVIGFMGLCGALMFVTIPNSASPVVFTLFGALATAFGTVIQYFFGSSKSSSDKTKLIAFNKDKQLTDKDIANMV